MLLKFPVASAIDLTCRPQTFQFRYQVQENLPADQTGWSRAVCPTWSRSILHHGWTFWYFLSTFLVFFLPLYSSLVRYRSLLYKYWMLLMIDVLRKLYQYMDDISKCCGKIFSLQFTKIFQHRKKFLLVLIILSQLGNEKLFKFLIKKIICQDILQFWIF